ncbi:hypothetical protein PTKIN_Ptkin14bG0138700 [Pterospermum kingtungense]
MAPNPESLTLKDCRKLVGLPSSIDGCKCLKTLNLSGCSKVETLPENLQHVESLEELDLSETAIRIPPSFIFQFKYLKVLSFNGCKEPPTKIRRYLASIFKVQQRGSSNSMGLMLPPLSGLTSLTKLNLCDCNLCEGAIPSDIYRLSSLELLYLCGNNFISLPATLTRLSKLISVDLSDCRRLKTLPDLLANVPANSKRLFEIVIPGRGIPEWFPHQSGESSIKMPLSRNIQNDSQWMGVAFCCIIDSTFNHMSCAMCHAVIHGVNSRKFFPFGFIIGCKDSPKDHFWLHYWPRDLLYASSSGEKCGEIFECSIVCNGPVEVKKCGIRIVCDKDLEEMEEMVVPL